MRRTLALAGAAVLTVGLGTLAGPASADPGITQQGPEAVMSEIAVDLDSSGFEGTYIELTASKDVPLEDYTLETCSATGSPSMVIAGFGPLDFVPANGNFLVADAAYRPGDNKPADFIVEDLGLDQSDGGVRLTDTGPLTDLHDSISWGDPTNPTCANFLDAGVIPDDDDSINRGDPWFLATPTPGV